MSIIIESVISFDIENSIADMGYCAICGVDEAGRGPLAGPVYAAAVVFDDYNIIKGLNDSKKLTAKKRELMFDEIIKTASDYAICFATPDEIDEINILNATFLAMCRCVEKLKGADFALVDGNMIKGLSIPSKCIVKGDGKSYSIAAASVLAKVSRDRYMDGLHEKYPQYNFIKHKGYPTKEHYELLREHGVIDEIYRKSFLKNL